MSYSFTRGDLIKPTKGSRYDPEHWRYYVVRVRPDGMWCLDPNWNTTWIPYGVFDQSDFEICSDSEQRKAARDCREIREGKWDHRFEELPGWE